MTVSLGTGWPAPYGSEFQLLAPKRSRSDLRSLHREICPRTRPTGGGGGGSAGLVPRIVKGAPGMEMPEHGPTIRSDLKILPKPPWRQAAITTLRKEHEPYKENGSAVSRKTPPPQRSRSRSPRRACFPCR